MMITVVSSPKQQLRRTHWGLITQLLITFVFFNDTCHTMKKGLNYYTITKNQLELIVSKDKHHSQKYIIHLLTYFHKTDKINAIY